MTIIVTVMAVTSASAQLKLSENNIDEILKVMTLEEKATLVVGHYFKLHDDQGNWIGWKDALVRGVAGQTQPIKRLGIPATALTDGPAGVRIEAHRDGTDQTYFATGFPVGICLASTWNTELVEQVAQSIGNEVREYGCDVLLAPGMNIHRHALCGRNFEYFSEDPVVTGRIAAAYVRGVQSQGVGTSIKHYAANNQETNRMGNDVRASQRTLREIYLKGFEIAVKEAHPWTVMSSYNRLNGPFTQAHPELLTTVLRDEWGFKGMVMTDWTDPRNTADQLLAGNDLMEPGYPAQTEEVINKVKSGQLPEEVLNRSVRRILEYIVKTPHYRGYKYSDRPDLKGHAAVTRQSAAEGMVLLKNEPVSRPSGNTSDPALPLKSGLKVTLYGINGYDFLAGGTGSGDVNKAYVVDLVEGLTNAGYVLNDEVKQLYQDYSRYIYKSEKSELGFFTTWGDPKMPEMPMKKGLARRMSKQDDVAIVCIGRVAGEDKDRKLEGDYLLTEVERQMLNDVCEAYHNEGKPVIIVLNVGNVIETESWRCLPDAILMAWQPGQEGGNSVADILCGRICPSGKLATTFPCTYSDNPASRNFPLYTNIPQPWGAPKTEKKDVDYTRYEEGIYVGYRYYETAKRPVSYPFGFGLSYTTFEYSKPRVRSVKGGFEASITVRNTGSVSGKEAVQLYVSAPSGAVEKPITELKAFAKTRELKPGESETLTMRVSNYDLASYVTSRHAWVADAGTYQLRFAANVQDTRARATYCLAKENVTLCHDVLNPAEPIKELSIKHYINE